MCDQCGGSIGHKTWNLTCASTGDDLDFCSVMCVYDWAKVRVLDG
jgi:hypothetical protein